METCKRTNIQNCFKILYLYIKLNDPNFVLIKATIQKRKIWKIKSKSLQRFTTVK